MKIFRILKKILLGLKRTERIKKLYAKQEWHECIAACNELINAKDAGNSVFFAYYYLGLVNFELNLIDESTQYLRTALDLTEDEISKRRMSFYRRYSKRQIIINYRKQRKYRLALNELELNITEDSAYISYYILKTEIYDDMGQTLDALKGLLLDPKNTELNDFRDHLSYIFSVEQARKRSGID